MLLSPLNYGKNFKISTIKIVFSIQLFAPYQTVESFDFMTAQDARSYVKIVPSDF